MTQPQTTLPPPQSNERWRFLRDVVVFQVKMLLDNIRDFALMPISLFAALIDLISKGEREGALFYRVLRWGSHSERVIDVYSAIEDHDKNFEVSRNYTVDGVIARLEGVLIRECEKGGTAASIKAAMDRAIDQLHAETSPTRKAATNAVSRTVGKLRDTIDSGRDKNDQPMPPSA
jgi:hypothetical protein